MKNILKIASILFLVIEANDIGAIAKLRNQHKIGFLESRSAGGNNGFCNYSLVGSKKKDAVVFCRSGGETSMNIDGNEIPLKEIEYKYLSSNSKQGRDRYYGTYSSGIFRVKINFIVANAGRNKSQNELFRESGVVSVSSNDGWHKNMNVECLRERIIGY